MKLSKVTTPVIGACNSGNATYMHRQSDHEEASSVGAPSDNKNSNLSGLDEA